METPQSSVEYAYDDEGIRVRSTVDGAVTYYLVNKNRDYAQVLEETDLTGSLIVSYIYGADLISQNRIGSLFYYHYDGLGSTGCLTDNAANVTDTYTYEAFGRLLAKSGSAPNSYLFAGEQYDLAVRFYYLRARYYVSDAGRFLTADDWNGPVFDPPSLHKYLYTKANPVNNTDPSGHFTLSEMIAVSGIIAVLSSGCSHSPDSYGGNLCYANEFIKTLDRWDYVDQARKVVRFNFRVQRSDPKKCCLVNFVMGWKTENGNFAKGLMLGRVVNADFPDWIIDSPDLDPVYWSKPGSRWRYTEVDPTTYRASDSPGPMLPGMQQSLDFKMCIYQCRNVPMNGVGVSAAGLMNRAVKCIDWKAKSTYKTDGTITYP